MKVIIEGKKDIGNTCMIKIISDKLNAIKHRILYTYMWLPSVYTHYKVCIYSVMV